MTQAQALDILKTGVNVYLTGGAGSGKTFTLNQYISYLQQHDIPVAITASTGIAATHMNGMTIHGWSGIGIRETLNDFDMDQLESKQYLWQRIHKTQVLIIDEVSMLHAHRLDMVDQVCRRFKRSSLPFGGIQVVLSGDFFQLPPISREGSPDSINRDMIIHSNVWNEMNPAVCYLTEQHRQEDERFVELLNMIRENNLEEAHYYDLQERMHVELPDGVRATRLYTHNMDVDAINQTELLKLPGNTHTYKMTSVGRTSTVETLKKSCLAYEELVLKINAEVLFIKNNFEQGYVNGTRGVVTGFLDDETPLVTIHNSGKVIQVTPAAWAIEEDGKVKASLNQIPLRLAWAITIHKSQGMSLDHAEIDLSKTFSYGMGYVALSRVRRLSGIRLVGFNHSALQVDPMVGALDIQLRKQSDENDKLFSALSPDEQTKLEHNFITRTGGTIRASKEIKKSVSKSIKISTIEQTRKLLEQGMGVSEIASERGVTVGTIIGHIDQLRIQGILPNIDHIRPDEKHIILVKKFTPDSGGKLSPIKVALDRAGHPMSFEQIRLALLFV